MITWILLQVTFPLIETIPMRRRQHDTTTEEITNKMTMNLNVRFSDIKKYKIDRPNEQQINEMAMPIQRLELVLLKPFGVYCNYA